MLSFDELNNLLKRELSPKRRLHVLGVEKEAAALALRWGENVESARQAALLHDSTKEIDNQLKLCDKYGIIPDTWTLANPKLFHAQTGAAAAKALGAPEEVVSAVRWHTTARPAMSLLEKIIYLADYVEPTRKKSGELTALRALVYDDIDRAMLKAIDMTLCELIGRGLEIHPDAWKARSYYMTTAVYPCFGIK